MFKRCAALLALFVFTCAVVTPAYAESRTIRDSHAGAHYGLPHGVDPIPGLSHGVGSDEFALWFGNLRRPHVIPRDFTQVWFADGSGELPQGDDTTGNGTKDYPWYSWAKLVEVMNTGNVVVYFDGAYDDTSASAELDSWVGSQLTARNCGSRYCAYLIGYSDNASTRASISCANAPTIDGYDADGGGGAVGVALDIEGQIVLANFDVLNCPLAPATPLSGGGDYDTHANISTGIVISENSDARVAGFNVNVIDSAGSHIHPFRAGNGTDAIWVNSHLRARDMADFDEDCVGGTCHSTLCSGDHTPWNACSGESPSQAYNQPHILETGVPSLLVVNTLLDINSTQITAASAGPVGSVSDYQSAADAQESFFNVFVKPPASLREYNDSDTAVGGLFTGLVTSTGQRIDRYYVNTANSPWPDVLKRVVGYDPMAFSNTDDGFTDSVYSWHFRTKVTGLVTAFYFRGMQKDDERHSWGRCNVVGGNTLVGDGSGQTDASMFNFTSGLSGGAVYDDWNGSNVYTTADKAVLVQCGGSSNNYVDAGATPRSECQDNAQSHSENLNADFLGSTEGGAEGALVVASGQPFDDGSLDLTSGAVCNHANCETTCDEQLLWVPTANLSASLLALLGEPVNSILFDGTGVKLKIR